MTHLGGAKSFCQGVFGMSRDVGTDISRYHPQLRYEGVLIDAESGLRPYALDLPSSGGFVVSCPQIEGRGTGMSDQAVLDRLPTYAEWRKMRYEKKPEKPTTLAHSPTDRN